MRTIFAASTLLLITACDSGGVVDQTIRQGVRQSAVEACTAWIPQSNIALAAGLDPDRLCACAADRILEGKSASELGDLRPGSPESRAAVAQCVAQIQTRPRAAGPS
jgi:hypothetical protein